LNRKYNLAIEELKRAIALNPNSANGYGQLGLSLSYSGLPEEGIESIKKGMRLSPIHHSWNYWNLAIAYREADRYEESIAEYRKILKLRPNNSLAYMGLSMTSALAGRFEEAREAYSEILKIDPEWSFEKSLKTIPFRPERIELVRAAMQKAGLPYKPPLPLPDKPSIAVLAFDNLSGDPEQEYFSDGLSEEIINALAKTDQLFVTARNSSFTYKGKPVDVKQVSRELGVRYVLEGSVRKYEDRVRITAQLIDATKGHHLWSERYDRDLKDIFALQDEVTKNIVVALEVKLTQGEQARMWAQKYKNLDVYLKRMEAWSSFHKGTLEGHMRHGQLAQEIIDMAPESPSGYYALGYHCWVLARYGKSPRENLKKAFELVQKAISLDESYPFNYSLLGSVYVMLRQYEKAIAAAERAIELDPNGADSHGLLGQTLNYAGRPNVAIGHLKKGIRLNPFPSSWYFSSLGGCYLQKGQYEKALTEFKKAVRLAPESPQNHGYLAITYILLGREEEARAAAAKSLELAPWVSVSLMSKTLPHKDRDHINKMLDAMRKAGFPEGT
jgi:adenylate cyclase